MPLKIKHGKTADITERIDMDCEFPEEINNGRCTSRQGKPKHEGNKDDGKQFLCIDHDLHSKKLAEFLVHLSSMLKLTPEREQYRHKMLAFFECS